MARDFSGTDQYLSAPTVAISGSHTLGLWAKFDALTYAGNDFGVAGIFAKGFWGGDGNGDTRLVFVNPNIQAQVDTSAGNTAAAWPVSNISTGTWYHIALTWDGTTTTLFVDGTSRATSTPGGTFSDNSRGILFGAYPNNVANTEMDGQLAEAAIWNAVLDASELAALTKGFSPPMIRPASLAAYWPLIGNASPEIELRGGAEATVTSATAIAHPRVIYPDTVMVATAAAAAAAATRSYRLSLMGVS